MSLVRKKSTEKKNRTINKANNFKRNELEMSNRSDRYANSTWRTAWIYFSISRPSNWIRFIAPAKNRRAKRIACILFDVFTTFWVPLILQRNNGCEFANKIVIEPLNLLSSSYNLAQTMYVPTVFGSFDESVNLINSVNYRHF